MGLTCDTAGDEISTCFCDVAVAELGVDRCNHQVYSVPPKNGFCHYFKMPSLNLWWPHARTHTRMCKYKSVSFVFQLQTTMFCFKCFGGFSWALLGGRVLQFFWEWKPKWTTFRWTSWVAHPWHESNNVKPRYDFRTSQNFPTQNGIEHMMETRKHSSLQVFFHSGIWIVPWPSLFLKNTFDVLRCPGWRFQNLCHSVAFILGLSCVYWIH